MKAESARQADESSRKNEVSTLSATIQARDSEIAVLKEEIYEIVKAGEVSKNCIKTLQVRVNTTQRYCTVTPYISTVLWHRTAPLYCDTAHLHCTVTPHSSTVLWHRTAPAVP